LSVKKAERGDGDLAYCTGEEKKRRDVLSKPALSPKGVFWVGWIQQQIGCVARLRTSKERIIKKHQVKVIKDNRKHCEAHLKEPTGKCGGGNQVHEKTRCWVADWDLRKVKGTP